MIRFPNPGSDIPAVMRIFKYLYDDLKDTEFSLDDMSTTLTNNGLAASSGQVGPNAMASSTRPDRSRDPLYNQSKMYAELFRALGWIASSNVGQALIYSFTLLGDHVAVAASTLNFKPIFEESLLGINFPNDILATKGAESSRVFSAILQVAQKLDGYICRDEIILSILNGNFNEEKDIDKIVLLVKELRNNQKSKNANAQTTIEKAILDLSKKINRKVTTMGNYTRFILPALTFCGWFTECRTGLIYPPKMNCMLKLTDYGDNRASELSSFYDIRLEEYNNYNDNTKKALIRLGFYTMLQRANFDISSVNCKIELDKKNLCKVIEGKQVLFSPFQTIRPETVYEALGFTRENSKARSETNDSDQHVTCEADEPSKTIIILGQGKNDEATSNITVRSVENNEIKKKEIIDLINKGCNDQAITSFLFNKYLKTDKNEFYPLIAEYFTILGFNCEATPPGSNPQRWDAIAKDKKFSIPIEIKSPSEELNISVKAVRQALENKIILLSREYEFKTERNTVTLAVGYFPPNKRAEVSALISAIGKTFSIKVGIIDFESLLKLAVSSLKGKGNNYVAAIRNMEGLIDVENI